MLDTARIAFIGTGNMANALIHGLINRGVKASHIRASDINESALARLTELWPIKTFTNNNDAIAGADVVVLAVKPQVLSSVAPGLAQAVQDSNSLVISIAAGVTTEKLTQWLAVDGEHSNETAIVRCMPNTPAMVEKGATGLFANSYVNAEQKDIANQLLQAVGITQWVDTEAKIDAITALSGSGPAYFFYLMESMIKAGEALGLDAALVKDFTLQTALGAAQLAVMSDDSPSVLRQKVTSPGGTTAAALDVFDENGMSQTVFDALRAADARAKELS